MLDGWVKLHRKLLESRVFANEGLLRTWVWCLLKANHQKEWVTLKSGRGYTEVEILPGQFVYGRKQAAKELGVKLSTIKNRIKKLENIGNLTIQPDTHYSVITIVNWDSYQSEKTKKDRQEDNQRTTKGQPKDTNKNDKNIYSDKLTQFVRRYIKHIKTQYPTKSPKGTSLEANSLEAIDKLVRLDGFDEDYVFDALRWAQKDDFWSTQIYSLAGLRKKSGNGLTKFQNLACAYDREKPEESGKKVPVFRVVNDE